MYPFQLSEIEFKKASEKTKLMGAGDGSGGRALLRYGSLAVVVLQTTVTVLLLRYSRTRATENPPYLASTAVLSSECCKFVVCVITLFVHAGWLGSNKLMEKPCHDFIRIKINSLRYMYHFIPLQNTQFEVLWSISSMKFFISPERLQS